MAPTSPDDGADRWRGCAGPPRAGRLVRGRHRPSPGPNRDRKREPRRRFSAATGAQKYPEKGRYDEKYKFFKKQLMSHTYDNLRALFKELENFDLIQETEYPEDVKDGYKPSTSGGSGFINTKLFDDWLISS